MRQNSTIKNLAQTLALILISGAAIIALMAIPADGDPNWFISFAASKAMGAAGFYLAYRMERRWRIGNKWLQLFSKECQRADETPNAIYARKEDK